MDVKRNITTQQEVTTCIPLYFYVYNRLQVLADVPFDEKPIPSSLGK